MSEYNNKFSYCYHIAELDDKKLEKCKGLIHNFMVDKLCEEQEPYKALNLSLDYAVELFEQKYSEEYGITKDLKGITLLNEDIDNF